MLNNHRPELHCINNRIDRSDTRIERVIVSLNDPKKVNKLILRFTDNHGGAIEPVIRLISAIDNSPAQREILLVFTGYAISAVAYLLAWYVGDCGPRKNVQVYAGNRLCVVYHKPRIRLFNIELFSSSLYPDVRYGPQAERVRQYTRSFDKAFNSLLQTCAEKGIRIAPHMDTIYHLNGDVTIIFNKGKL